MFKKSLVANILVALIILSMAVIIIMFIKSNAYIIKYIESKGFVKQADSGLYEKNLSNVSEYEFEQLVSKEQPVQLELLYFNINSYELFKYQKSYDRDVLKYFTAQYNFRTEEIEYNYRANMSYLNIIMQGTYKIKTHSFTCDSTFHANVDYEAVKDIVCQKLRIENETFSSQLLDIINDKKLINKIKKSLK